MTTIQGPAAPKDPTRKRPFFYIMQEKEIFGAKQTDGRGIQFIYENDNRLINSAQIAGNVTDEEILELLKTTEGFRKLVHSIGVTVDIVTPVSQIQKVRFAFQMYGKTDPYVSGNWMMQYGQRMIKNLDRSVLNFRRVDYRQESVSDSICRMAIQRHRLWKMKQ